MITFLTPAALTGLLLLSLPVVLHLFKPRKVRQTPFSSLRWLRASQHRLSRRIKWHQILLFLLRAAFLTLLVLALAEPVFSPSAQAGPVRRFVVLDLSRSMGYQSADGPAPIDRARAAVEQLARAGGGGDRATLVLAGSRARVLGPLVSDPAIYLPAMSQAAVEAGPADLTGALEAIRPLAAGEDDTRVELFLVTDNHAENWSQAAVARFMEGLEAPLSVKVVEVGTELPGNAWIASAQLAESTAARRTLLRVQLGAVGAEPAERTVSLTGLANLPEQSRHVTLQPGQVQTVEFELPAELPLAGQVAHLRLEPADGLMGDDQYWLNLDRGGATRVLVIEPELTEVEELQPGFHLRSALEALSAATVTMPLSGGGGGGALVVERQPPTAILAPAIARADLVVLVDVPRLSEGDLRAVEERVRAGAGLVAFLGPSIDLTFYNTQLHDPLRPSASLSPVTIGPRLSLGGEAGGLPGLEQVDWSHPLFAALADPVYSDLAEARFQVCHELHPADERMRVAARIGDQAPAIVDRPLGAGRVLLLNTTANDAWSSLPRRRSFLPLVDRMVAELTGGPGRGMFEAGEPVRLALPAGAAGQPVTITGPRGGTITAAAQPAAGRAFLHLEGLTEPGPYRVTYAGGEGQAERRFVVNAAAAESPMIPADHAALTAWWQGAQLEFQRPDEGSAPLDLPPARRALTPWLVGLACLALLAEMFFVHWLCPRMNPSVVSASRVAGRGFFEREPEGEAR